MTKSNFKKSVMTLF